METFKSTRHATRQETRKNGTLEGSNWPRYEHQLVTVEGLVTIHIDLERLFKELGSKALTSKSKRAVEASGAIVATAANIRELSRTEWHELAR